jgi:hypothetical protein
MKKKPKKLVLAKESVRNLEETGLGNIAGGMTTQFTGISCGDAPGFCLPRITNTAL